MDSETDRQKLHVPLPTPNRCLSGQLSNADGVDQVDQKSDSTFCEV